MTKSSPNKSRLLKFLNDEYGKRIISGQMDTSWTINSKMDMITRVFSDTGKYPALKGFDLIQLPYNYPPFFGGMEQIEEAIEWWEGKNNGKRLLPDNPDIHGIVTFCWHWRAGNNYAFYTDKTDFRIPWIKDGSNINGKPGAEDKSKTEGKLDTEDKSEIKGRLDTESENFKIMIDDMDKAASLLNILKEKDIPVLWRPLHEAAGGWFWWGASGPAPYIALWEYMYDYYTNVKGLDNLIWVWSAEDTAWFPNPDTVEITGVDLYTENYSSLKEEFEKAKVMAPTKDRITALSENDRLPDPDECLKENMMWSWFMTWNDMRFKEGETRKDNFWTGEFHNPQAHKEKVYNHPLVITLDKLPDITNYT